MSRGHPGAIVLVAGAWHGAWCWQRLTPLLEQHGHRVLTPELAGTGNSDADPARASLEGWAKSIAELCAAQSDPVMLVGHSRGGIVISRAAELVPGQIQRLVYLAAYLLPAGQQIAAAAREDAQSLVPANMVAEREGITCALRSEVVAEALFGGCDQETIRWASGRLTPEPVKPLVTPLRITAERYGRVPRTYIECTRDRTIGIDAQRRMQAAQPCDPVHTLDTGHAPFLSCPAELAELLRGT
jgi:pimeloyl-ACP methyl ester carboxylesterase